MTETVTIDTASFERSAARLGRIGERHVPNAIRKALNRTVFKARADEQAMLREDLDRAKEFTLRSIRYRPAEQIGGYLTATLYAAPTMAPILHRLEYGGVVAQTRTPVEAIQDKYGNLRKGQIQRLLASPYNFEKEIRGTYGIWGRPGGRGALRLLVSYNNDTVYRKGQIHFNATAEAAGLRFGVEVNYAFNELVNGDPQ